MSSDKKLINSLLDYSEWHKFETKRAAVQPKRLLETVCAFSNTLGGILVIGMEDSKKAEGKNRLIGISEKPDNVSEFLKLLRSEFEPPLHHIVSTTEIDIKNTKKKKDKLLLVRVTKSNDIHSSKSGDTFVRRGSQNVKIGAQEIMRLRYEKGSIKIEEEITSLTDLSELDPELLNQYMKDTNSDSTDKWQFLKDNGLAKKKEKKLYLTIAAILLFGKNPAVLLGKKCSIKVSHYYGTKPNFSEKPNFIRKPFSLEGPLLKQIVDCIEYFRTIVKQTAPTLSGATFKSNLLIPEWVFQEAIVNAVIHRNYHMQDDIQVRIFDDRIEIESPGSYPAHITSSNIRTERFARNPVIQRVLNRFQDSPNLDIGEGVDRMFELMKNKNLYEPLFLPITVRPNTVHLFLLNLEKTDYWDTISLYLNQNARIDNKTAREITGITDTLYMSRLFSQWLDQGLLIKKGESKKGTYYVKPSEEENITLFSDPLKIN